MLSYTAEAARRSTRVSRTVLSTEDAKIARIGQECGIEVPFLRPRELAADDTPTLPVLQHMVRALEADGDYFDAVLTLQPTSPFRLPRDIDGSVELMEQTGADSVISFVDVGEKHPSRMKTIDNEGRVWDPPFAEAVEGQPRQTLPKLYLRDGSIYLTRRNVLMDLSTLKGVDCRAWIVPQARACNIDTPFDLFLAEQLLKVQHAPECQYPDR